MELSFEVKEFIEKYIELIDENKFDTLYKLSAEELGTLDLMGEVSLVLLSCGLDILKHTNNEIPEGFRYKHRFTHLIVPEGIEAISHSAFAHCPILQEVTLPKSLSVIRKFVFDYCTNLRVINWNATNLSLCDYTAFSHCFDLRKIVFAGTSQQWKLLVNRCELRFPSEVNPMIVCSDGSFEWKGFVH